MKDNYMTTSEQQVLVDLSDELSRAGYRAYEDRDEYGIIGFLVCQNGKAAREILEDSPAIVKPLGEHSLIVTARHPDRDHAEGREG